MRKHPETVHIFNKRPNPPTVKRIMRTRQELSVVSRNTVVTLDVAPWDKPKEDGNG